MAIQASFNQPAETPWIFNQDSNHVSINVGDTANPINLTGATVTFTYKKIDGTVGTITSGTGITVTPASPTVNQSNIQFEMPVDLASTSDTKKLAYILSFLMPGDAAATNLVAGQFWRKSWV